MRIEFKIIKLIDHHNRGQFIAARQLNFKEPVIIKEGSLLNGIPIYHYLEINQFSEEKNTEFEIYFFRPTELEGYPKVHFEEGQVVELIL